MRLPNLIFWKCASRQLWKFGTWSFETLELRNFGTLKLWNFETWKRLERLELLELWNFETFNWSLGSCLIPNAYNIRRPPLGGTKAAGLEIVVLFTINNHCYSVCFYVFSGPKYPGDYHPQLHFSRSAFHKKTLRFQTCFRGLENQKNRSQRLQKTIKFDPTIH